MVLDRKTTMLVAVGASVAANCQPCLKTSLAKAREGGAKEQEIDEALKVGKLVRQGAASKMDTFAAGLRDASPSPQITKDEECSCQ